MPTPTPQSKAADQFLAPVPEVSLISSWYVPLPTYNKDDQPVLQPYLPSLKAALRHGVRLHDLYFLAEGDLPWYAEACGMEFSPEISCLDFAAELTETQIKDLARKLTAFLAEHYQGPLIGLRPRFTALATYWPCLSLPEKEDPEDKDKNPRHLWDKSVKAVGNSLYLAHRLGCRHVEIVAGAAVPEAVNAREEPIAPEIYRERRMRRLVDGLCMSFEHFARCFKEIPNEKYPFLCVELEPGSGHLISRLEDFFCPENGSQRARDLFHCLKDAHSAKRWRDQVLLNADLAHILLSEGEREAKVVCFKEIAQLNSLGHIHISDHARSHAADLRPGVYHFKDSYAPYLKVALEQTCLINSKFSRAIAVELEACNDVQEALRAMARVSQWIEELQRSTPASPADRDPQIHTGAFMVVDIGNSTKFFFSNDPKSLASNARALAYLVSELCSKVQEHRGSVLSFTGDGVIAFFETAHFLDAAMACEEALDAIKEIRKLLFAGAERAQKAQKERSQEIQSGSPSSSQGFTLRAGLHYGEVFIPASGHLRHQAISEDVVITARLCDWIAKTIEPAVPAIHRTMITALSSDFYKKLKSQVNSQYVSNYQSWGKPDPTFKGTDREIDIFLDSHYFFSRRSIRKNKPAGLKLLPPRP